MSSQKSSLPYMFLGPKTLLDRFQLKSFSLRRFTCFFWVPKSDRNPFFDRFGQLKSFSLRRFSQYGIQARHHTHHTHTHTDEHQFLDPLHNNNDLVTRKCQLRRYWPDGVVASGFCLACLLQVSNPENTLQLQPVSVLAQSTVFLT